MPLSGVRRPSGGPGPRRRRSSRRSKAPRRGPRGRAGRTDGSVRVPLEITLPELTQTPDDPPTVPNVVRANRLAGFFEKVAQLLRGRAHDHIRIAVYGDSNLTMDFMTGRMRRVLQREHGDAGHGFVALGRPWSHYRHMDILHGVKKGFMSYACSTTPVLDGIYGISGIAAESLYSGAKTWVETAGEDAPIGQRVSAFDIYYMKSTRGGTLTSTSTTPRTTPSRRRPTRSVWASITSM